MTAKRSMEELMDELRSDRLIRFCINGDAQPYLIQREVLITASPNIVNELEKEGQIKVRCDKEYERCWQTAVYWIVRHALPEDWIDQADLIRCWVLADKYHIRAFQDEIMITLMESFNSDKKLDVTFDIIRKAFKHTSSGSKLREVLAEYVVVLQKREKTKHLFPRESLVAFRGTEAYALWEEKYMQYKADVKAGRGEPDWQHKFGGLLADTWKRYLFAPEKYDKLRYRGIGLKGL